MGFFHIRSIPGTVWPAIPFPQASLIWNAYQELDRTQWLPAEVLQKFQLQQLNTLLTQCRRQSPYYSRLLQDAEIGDRGVENLAQFRRIPFLTRQLYQTHFADIQARNLPQGMVPIPKPSYTSGTNGVPIKVLNTNLGALWWQAFYLRDLEWAGMDPRGKLASIRLIAMSPADEPRMMQGISTASWNKSCEMLIETGPSHAIDIRLDPRRQLEWLREIRPDYLLSMPTNLELLAGLVEESGGPWPELKMIRTMGEPMSLTQRQRIEAGFNVPVKDIYSTTETGHTASPCPTGQGLHVHSEGTLVELLDADNNPVAPGQTGRIVFTNLHNFIAPFIRYEIMDEVTLAPGPCSCGRGLPLWSRVEGRQYPMLHLADGGKKSSIGIVLGLRKTGGAHQFQMVQRQKDKVLLRVVPDRSWTPEHAERMKQVIHHEFEFPIPVEIEELPYIKRLRGGKLKLIDIDLQEA